MRFILVLVLVISISGCASYKEDVMPFTNFGYSGERLFPVSKSDSEFSFRAWVNYSTSVDRVFTVSYNKDLGYKGNILEIRKAKTGKNNKDNTTFKEFNIEPKSGFKNFIAKVDSLDLLTTQDQKDFQSALHQPFSLYVIEFKSQGKLNQFKFNTTFPVNKDAEGVYKAIQELIIKEFDFKFYTAH